MTFRLVVHRVTRVANVVAADGLLERGTLRNGARAIARTARGDVPVVVVTVAMVDPPRADRRDVTLTLQVASEDVTLLEGAVIEEEPP